jgi:endonuclease/exonuclease/phosphatase (EEP) superfamily protein YafD
MHRAMDLIRAVAFLMAAASALAAALALGGAISPRLDIFAHATPVWLAGALVALALQWAAGPESGRGALALVAVTILICAFLMAPEFVAHLGARRAAPASQTVKVIQFNVWDRNRDPAATATWIRNEDADVVILEEAAEAGSRVAAALTDRYPYRSGCGPEDECATTILSKVAPSDGGDFIWAGVGPRHAGAWATFGQGASAYAVAGVHYEWPIPPGPQVAQARLFAGALDRFDRRSLIVGGDFNLTPWSFGLRRQDARFGLVRLTRAMATWPAGKISHWRLNLPFPLLAIDHLYAGKSWRVVSVTRGPVLGSDHYPIVAVLTR